jgi:hypothetical protein
MVVRLVWGIIMNYKEYLKESKPSGVWSSEEVEINSSAKKEMIQSIKGLSAEEEKLRVKLNKKLLSTYKKLLVGEVINGVKIKSLEVAEHSVMQNGGLEFEANGNTMFMEYHHGKFWIETKQ